MKGVKWPKVSGKAVDGLYLCSELVPCGVNRSFAVNSVS